MASNWTLEQLEAITQRDCNLLVAAAAGAGKTAVLVERIIRKITDSEKPVDIDKLLVVTFTNAAATEMRERIGSALADALEADPSSANLQRQMALLDHASIMTLHSFCLEVVRSHFHNLDMDPVFRISDETESTLMKLDVLEELFEEKYENEDAESVFFKLVDSYGGGRDDSSLREIVLTLHRFTSSHPWPEQWLATQAEAFNIGASACLSSTPWACVLLKSAAAELQGLKALLEKAAALASQAQGLEPYCGVLEADIQQLDMLSQALQTSDTQAAVALVPGAKATGTLTDTVDVLSFQCGGKAATPESPAVTPAATPAATQDAAATPDWDAIHTAFNSYEPARLPRCAKDADTAAQEEVKAARSLMKEKLKKLCESGFSATAPEIVEDFQKLYPLFKYLSAMVCEFDAGYSQKKKNKGLLDFNDLEHYCLKILLENGLPTSAAKELREKYEEILVDEYQDSNLIQELILETVSGNQDGRYNIFMVGDVKQSIYRFRQARPELFLSKYATYPHESGNDSRVIQLYKNFRSRPEIINGVNFIFKQIMSSLIGELDYTDEEALNPGAEFEEPDSGCNAGGSIELHIIDVTSTQAEILPEERRGAAQVGQDDGYLISPEGNRYEHSAAEQDTRPRIPCSPATLEPTLVPSSDNTDGSTESEEEPLDNIQAEARIVGKRIRSLVSRSKEGFNVYDRKLSKYRPTEYRDIVILMRATRNWADVFTDELAAMGIPAYADTGLGYFKTVEVETMLSLLQIIDNPLQDIPLLAVLRSPIGGFNTDELADIRLADRSSSFFEAMRIFSSHSMCTDAARQFSAAGIPDISIQHTAADNLNEAQKKTSGFLQQLQAWRNDAQFMPTDELVWQLLSDTGYYSYAGILPGGSERQANLRMLFERARQYEETSYKGLFNFINFIGKLRSGGGDMGSAKVLGENDNVVRIMSIHKSKGLEFPVVILSGCGKRFNMRDLNASILLHQDLGFGPDLVDLERRTISPTLSKFAIRQKLRLETLSEEMRILYVAFTRAKEKLIMTGCVRDVNKACSRWCAIADTKSKKLPQYDMQQASTYLEWLGPALARHKSAESFRQAATPYGSIKLVQNEQSCWDIKLWGVGAAAVEKEAATAEENIRQWLEAVDDLSGNTMTSTSEPVYSAEQLIKKLEWQYPYRTLSAVPSKLSVTELKRRFENEEQLDSASHFVQNMVARPIFMEHEKGLGAARIGTVMHFVMQHVDLNRVAAIQNAEEMESKANELNRELEAQLVSMADNEQLTAAEAEVVNIAAISAFFRTSVGKRMLKTMTVRRETSFNIEIKCIEIYKELPEELYGNETMLLQGVIDCWFETEGGLVLLDYKTDYVPAGGAEIIRERYKVQLDYYARALERITGKKVVEKYLYLFHSGELLSC